MSSEQQYHKAIRHLEELLAASPLLEEENKAQLVALLRNKPSRVFLQKLYALLTNEMKEYEEILETMSDEDIQEIERDTAVRWRAYHWKNNEQYNKSVQEAFAGSVNDKLFVDKRTLTTGNEIGTLSVDTKNSQQYKFAPIAEPAPERVTAQGAGPEPLPKS